MDIFVIVSNFDNHLPGGVIEHEHDVLIPRAGFFVNRVNADAECRAIQQHVHEQHAMALGSGMPGRLVMAEGNFSVLRLPLDTEHLTPDNEVFVVGSEVDVHNGSARLSIETSVGAFSTLDAAVEASDGLSVSLVLPADAPTCAHCHRIGQRLGGIVLCDEHLYADSMAERRAVQQVRP